jgi:hypothetical protein
VPAITFRQEGGQETVVRDLEPGALDRGRQGGHGGSVDDVATLYGHDLTGADGPGGMNSPPLSGAPPPLRALRVIQDWTIGRSAAGMVQPASSRPQPVGRSNRTSCVGSLGAPGRRIAKTQASMVIELALSRYRGLPMSSPRVPGGVVHKLPGDLRKALIANPTALDAWTDITPLARNEFICWVEEAKQEMTRDRRIRRTQEELEEGQRRPCCWPGCKHRERTGR